IAYVRFRPGPYTEEDWIELFNLEQGTKRVVLSDPHLSVWGLIWLQDGRLLYVVYEPPPSQNSSNFWAASLDLSTGPYRRDTCENHQRRWLCGETQRHR